MHIIDILSAPKPSLSFEFYPPRAEAAWEELYETIQNLETLSPSFVSVTYGAGGSTRELTHDLVLRIIKPPTSLPFPTSPVLDIRNRKLIPSSPVTLRQAFQTSSHYVAIHPKTNPITIGHKVISATPLISSPILKNSMTPATTQTREASALA